MKKYKILEVKSMDKNNPGPLLEDAMNNMAEAGWRVVGVTRWESNKETILITFERDESKTKDKK